MPALADVRRVLDGWFDLASFPEEDGNGLVVRDVPASRPVDLTQDVRRVGYAVNCSFEVMKDALHNEVDLLLTHHAAWPRTEGTTFADFKELTLRKWGIAHYVCHLPLDCADDVGTSAVLCQLLGVEVRGAFADVGNGHMAGRYGTLPEQVTLNAFVARLSDALSVAPYVMLGGPPTVQHVAVFTGGGGDTRLLEEARCQAYYTTYVTGEGSLYTKLYARERGMNLLLGTHTATERPGIEALARRLQAALPGLEAVGLRETPFE